MSGSGATEDARPARLAGKLALGAAALALLVGVAFAAVAWWDSRIPGTYGAMQFGTPDYGGAAVGGHVHQGSGVSVAELTGPAAGKPDARFTLTAEHARIRLSSGAEVDALTFNGRAPGPELRAHTGDLVEVMLRNKDVADGVTIHWHGLDIPNAEDGVAGVTQNAVPVGGRHIYRFRVQQTGTFWYHTHQRSHDGVRRGLFGPIVVEPRRSAMAGSLDLTIVAHTFDGLSALNTTDDVGRRPVPPGTHVRLRLVNSDSSPETFALSGTPFEVVAIDGTDLHGPSAIRARAIVVPAGGRYDLAFTAPSRPVRLDLVGTKAALVFGAAGPTPPAVADGTWPTFDPLAYGRPALTRFGASSHFDRTFMLEVTRKFGLADGRPGFHWAINGHTYPDVPMFVVHRDDLVKVTVVNDTSAVHPMHLHGHHMLVLSRNGVHARGSPWWSDTLGVEPHATYEVAFRADNPGLWMDHCHNLQHAAAGLTMHVTYEGVRTPFVIGGPAHNAPE